MTKVKASTPKAPKAAKLTIDSAVAKTAPAKAAPKKKAKKLMDIQDFMDEEGLDPATEKIAGILTLFVAGYKQKEIVEAGYNKSTVYRQTGEYNKLKKGPITTYFGFECFEARIAKLMKNKKLTREQALEKITEMDMAATSEADSYAGGGLNA